MKDSPRKNLYSLREFSGAMGDFGTLIPLATGFIIACGLDPASLLVAVGLVSIITGLVFRLPLPVEPMKVIAVIAISQGWDASMVYASGFAMGLVWIIFSFTGLIELIARYTPRTVIRGIQAALGIMLIFQALPMLATWWLLGLASLILALLLRRNRHAPAVLVLILIGIGAAFYRGLPLTELRFAFNLPSPGGFTMTDLWPAMLLAGFAQIPLTATNAVLSTASLLKTYWPGEAYQPKKLAVSIGVFNLALPFLGGMPICHGAGGLAAKHYFGARTGGANISIGIAEIICGLLFAPSIALLLVYFPEAIIGAMLLLVGVELFKFVRDVTPGWELIPLVATIIVSVWTNMALGFLAGMILYYSAAALVKRTEGKRGSGN